MFRERRRRSLPRVDARNWPLASGLIHAMSSPTVQTFQPSNPAVE